MLDAEFLDVIYLVTDTFNSLGVEHAIGGSVASIVHGIMRNTLDVDIVAALTFETAVAFHDALKDTFFIDLPMIESAIASSSSFNIFHQETMLKVDVFIPKNRLFDKRQLENRVLSNLPAGSVPQYVASAEDTILAKLAWYRLGNEVSERQWRDVLGVLKVQEDRLDVAYMREMAATLAVGDLLEQALVSLE